MKMFFYGGKKLEVYADSWENERDIISALYTIKKNYGTDLFHGLSFIRYTHGNIYTHPYNATLKELLNQYIDNN